MPSLQRRQAVPLAPRILVVTRLFASFQLLLNDALFHKRSVRTVWELRKDRLSDPQNKLCRQWRLFPMAQTAYLPGGVPIGRQTLATSRISRCGPPRGHVLRRMVQYRVDLVAGRKWPHRAMCAIVDTGDQCVVGRVVGWVGLEFLNPSILHRGSLAYAHT